MNPEIGWDLFEFVQTEKSWSQICARIKQPLPIISIALKQLVDNEKIIKIVRSDDIYYAQKQHDQ